LSELRCKYYFDDCILTTSFENKNPYGKPPYVHTPKRGWEIYLDEWLIRYISHPDYLKVNQISKVEETIIDDHFLKQYELIRFAYVIEEAGQIQRPYYNIAIIRPKNEYTNFYLFVMKSKTNQVKMFKEILQSFNPTNYTKAIFEAIISFDNHEYERSRKAWEEVLQYDELSVIANTGLGNAYYYDLQFEEAARYYAIAKNRSMYSEAFWEIRNTWLQNNLTVSILILASFIVVLLILIYLFRSVPALVKVKKKAKEVKKTRFFKDLTVGFRMIRKPTDTFYELKTNRRGSVLGATIYYILALVIFTWYMYGKALPFQIFNENTLSASIVIFGFIGVLAIFVLCNYLVSAIKNGEGTFKNIYKFTGYCLLPIIICLPIAVGLSYVLTLTEKIIMDLLLQLALWGSIFFIVMGILETHNYTFKQTFWNVILTIIFMLLFVIVCLTVLLMFDQVKNLVESIIKEVKLRAGWY